jgi:hypothetical protein
MIIIQADKIVQGGVCHEKCGELKNVSFPLNIWKYKNGFNINTGKGKYLCPVRNFGGEKKGDLLIGNVPNGERNYYIVVDSVYQTVDTRTISFSFLCYVDEFINRFIENFNGDTVELFNIIYSITNDIIIATNESINFSKKNINKYISTLNN